MPILKIHSELDNVHFVPGDQLRGSVEWSDLPGSPSLAELRLFHFTSGKGTRDLDAVEVLEFETPLVNDRREFDFTLPDSPPSFSGKLITLTWALDLVIETGDGEEEFSERLEFQLSPKGSEIDLYAHAAENVLEKPSGKKPWFNFIYTKT